MHVEQCSCGIYGEGLREELGHLVFRTPRVDDTGSILRCTAVKPSRERHRLTLEAFILSLITRLLVKCLDPAVG